MQRRSTPSQHAQPDVMVLAASTWLAIGIVLLGLTPLPLHEATLGWSPAFWLLLAPSLVLCVRWCFPAQWNLPRAASAGRRENSPRARRRRTTSGLVGSEREHRDRHRHATRRIRQAG